MDEIERNKISGFLSEIETSEDARKKFISDPLQSLAKLSSSSDETNFGDLGLTNKVLLAALANPSTLDRIEEIQKNHTAGSINEHARNFNMAKELYDAAPADVRQEILQLWGKGELTADKFRGSDAYLIGNIIVAANESAIVNHSVIHSTEWVTSGSYKFQRSDLIRVANMLTKVK